MISNAGVSAITLPVDGTERPRRRSLSPRACAACPLSFARCRALDRSWNNACDDRLPDLLLLAGIAENGGGGAESHQNGRCGSLLGPIAAGYLFKWGYPLPTVALYMAMGAVVAAAAF